MTRFHNMVNIQRHIRLSILIHMLLWASLTLWVSKWILLPGVSIGSTYGISSKMNEHSKSKLTINDFSSHFNFVKKAWFGQTTANSGASIYSLENHLKVTSDWAGMKVNNALPFGYSPTMLWVLAPLIFFPHIIAWCIFNITGLFSIWWATHPARCRLGVGLLAFFSPLALSCFILGQTALLTGAGLLFIAENIGEKDQADGWRSSIPAGIALWAITAKPPIALTAGVVLVGLRKWRPLILAVTISVLSTLAITPILGTNWLHDYLQLIGSYDRISADSAYAWSFSPSQMANLRGILSVDFGISDNVASLVSNIMWFITLFFLATVGNRPGLARGPIWPVAILSYLLFCPHVSSTEELQLVLLLPLCLRTQNKLNWQELGLLIMVPLLPFASPAIGLLSGYRVILFIAKILLVIFIIVTMRKSKISDVHTTLTTS